MAIDFPNSPNVGDTHSDGGAVWKWSGYAWRRVPDPGAKGEPGDKGQKGEIGLTGNQGDKGEKGAPSTVAGAKGQKGEDGEKGSTGADGDKGIKGEPSTEVGPKGDKGDKGGVGAGTKGEKGAGSSVTIGVSPPTSPTPAAGDMWWDSDDADLHVYYNDGNSAQWVSVTSSAALKGQTGDKGQKGEKGEVGEKGQKGQTGDKGQKGDVGPQGGSGGVGDKGEQGIKGEKGQDNSTKGQKGQKGEQGTSIKGEPGADNSTKGSKGEPGSGGTDGDDGIKGQKGDTGSTTFAVPSGGIIIWSGAANAIPSGWYLCDGNNGTPNLSGKFVVGYHASNGDYDVNDTGGAESITLSESQIPSHYHYAFRSGNAGQLRNGSNLNSSNYPGSGTGAGNLYETYNITARNEIPNVGRTSNAGSTSPHENRPPFYALCYIMKS